MRKAGTQREHSKSSKHVGVFLLLVACLKSCTAATELDSARATRKLHSGPSDAAASPHQRAGTLRAVVKTRSQHDLIVDQPEASETVSRQQEQSAPLTEKNEIDIVVEATTREAIRGMESSPPQDAQEPTERSESGAIPSHFVRTVASLPLTHVNGIAGRSPSEFLTLSETLEMARLSRWVYSFRDAKNDTEVCTSLFPNKTATTIHRRYECHWYRHDRSLGTQVMIIASSLEFGGGVSDFVAVVFAGTDDVRTALIDVDVWMTPFGYHWKAPSSTDDSKDDWVNFTSLIRDPYLRIHNGFDKEVFGNGIYAQLRKHVQRLLTAGTRPRRLYTTGHSLGGANAILTAVALTLEYRHGNLLTRNESPPVQVTSVSFGCPRTGNTNWRDFVHSQLMSPPFGTAKALPELSIWRNVLGWDLIPRLPDLYKHVGHTIQIDTTHNWTNYFPYTDDFSDDSTEKIRKTTTYAKAYYQHYGNATLDLAGVPFGWAEKSYIWIPGALESHHMGRYWKLLSGWWNATTAESHEFSKTDHLFGAWVKEFVALNSTSGGNSSAHDNYDDGFWFDDDILHEAR